MDKVIINILFLISLLPLAISIIAILLKGRKIFNSKKYRFFPLLIVIFTIISVILFSLSIRDVPQNDNYFNNEQKQNFKNYPIEKYKQSKDTIITLNDSITILKDSIATLKNSIDNKYRKD